MVRLFPATERQLVPISGGVLFNLRCAPRQGELQRTTWLPLAGKPEVGCRFHPQSREWKGEAKVNLLASVSLITTSKLLDFVQPQMCFWKAIMFLFVAGFARNPVQWTSPQLWASSLSVLFPTNFLRGKGLSAPLPAPMCHQQMRELALTVKASSGSCSRSNIFARDQLHLMQVYHHICNMIYSWGLLHLLKPTNVRWWYVIFWKSYKLSTKSGFGVCL